MPIRELKFKVRIVVEKDDDGSLFAYCPDLNGLFVSGQNHAEIRANVQDAFISYMESILKHNDPIPVGVCQSDNKYSFREFFGHKLRGLFQKDGDYIEEFSVPCNAVAA